MQHTSDSNAGKMGLSFIQDWKKNFIQVHINNLSNEIKEYFCECLHIISFYIPVLYFSRKILEGKR